MLGFSEGQNWQNKLIYVSVLVMGLLERLTVCGSSSETGCKEVKNLLLEFLGDPEELLVSVHPGILKKESEGRLQKADASFFCVLLCGLPLRKEGQSEAESSDLK